MFNLKFWRAAWIRACRTVAGNAVTFIGTAAVLSDVDWKFVCSAALLSGAVSLLQAVSTGLPEAENNKEVAISGDAD